MSHNVVLKYVAPKMPIIIIKRAEEIFPALKENLVSVLHRKLIYQLVFFYVCIILFRVRRLRKYN